LEPEDAHPSIVAAATAVTASAETHSRIVPPEAPRPFVRSKRAPMQSLGPVARSMKSTRYAV
jgi:hypothetical protein